MTTPPPNARNGFFATIQAVLWSFAGIRRGKDYLHDAQHLRPVHLIVAGLLAGLVFVLMLLLAVRLIVANA